MSYLPAHPNQVLKSNFEPFSGFGLQINRLRPPSVKAFLVFLRHQSQEGRVGRKHEIGSPPPRATPPISFFAFPSAIHLHIHIHISFPPFLLSGVLLGGPDSSLLFMSRTFFGGEGARPVQSVIHDLSASATAKAVLLRSAFG